MGITEHAPSTLEEYAEGGGVRGLEKALAMSPDEVIAEVRDSGLRGRGGAAFPTGVKWRSLRDAETAVFVCNAAEGEPATFKDRYLIRRNPYQILEGLAIAAYATGASQAIVGLKDVFTTEIRRLEGAIGEMQEADALGGIDVTLSTGPDHFLTGEETGLLEAIAGRQPLPTGVPTFVRGLDTTPPLFGPTGVNNVETLACVPHILSDGADWLRRWGTEDSPGTVVFTICGDVEREGCYELPLGIPMRELVEEHAGGIPDGHELMVIVPGASHHVLTPERLDTPLDHRSMSEAGSALGAGGFAVFDDTACIVRVAHTYARFLYVESCGQCPPCKEGTGDIVTELEKIEKGQGTKTQLTQIMRRLETVQDGRKCELPTGTRHVVESLVRLFPGEFEEHLGTECPSERSVRVPKIVDQDESGFVYDRRYYLKRPDWTYAS